MKRIQSTGPIQGPRPKRPMVFICSPYAGCIHENVRYARFYSRLAYVRGYMPITPHLMYPRFLADGVPREREDGLAMGLRLLELCEELWVFGDRFTSGMQREMAYALARFKTIRYFNSDGDEQKKEAAYHALSPGID